MKNGERRYDQIILAVPDGAPARQWLQIHSVDLEDDAEGHFKDLVDQGRLSALDLLVLAKELHGVDSVGRLPDAGALAHEFLNGMRPPAPRLTCTECTPSIGPSFPDTVSHAGEGGPVLSPRGSSGHPDQNGGVHYGPGWPPKPSGPTPSAAPPPALPKPGLLERAHHAINRLVAKLFNNKRECDHACKAIAVGSGFVAYVCTSAGIVRALPQIGVPCEIGDVIGITGAIAGETFCPAWCDDIYEMFPEIKSITTSEK